MSDYTLMNPAYINKEIDDLEQLLVPQGEALEKKLHEDIDRIINYFRETYNAGEPTTLTTDQVRDVIVTLSNIDMKLYHFSTWHKHALRVYKLLKTDKRWIIGSKLRFLQK